MIHHHPTKLQEGGLKTMPYKHGRTQGREADEMNVKWEKIESAEGYIRRAKVPGGRLIFYYDPSDIGGTTFYPDPNHEWDGGSMD